MNEVHLTGLDAYVWAFIWTAAFTWIGWRVGRGDADRIRAKYEGHLSAFAVLMAKFPIVKLYAENMEKETKDD